jgi:hypothetical protein
MNWKTKLAFLLLCSIPAFTGYPLNRFGALVVDGITWAWAAYLFISHFTVLVLCGRKQYARILTAAALVTLPVIGSGGCISFLASLFETDLWHAQVIYSTHYLRLCVTMLTVIPLALGLVATIPLQSFEQQLLQNRSGVSMTQKMFLMALRVFNHIVYYVIPNILEVVREERQFLAFGGDEGARSEAAGIFKRIVRIMRGLTQVAGEGICAAVQYIPLWAVEISRLPTEKPDGFKQQSK